MNILILSCGTRNKIVQYFKRTIGSNGKIICTDCSDLAPAIYEGDKFYIVPKMTEPGYIDVILDICIKEKISGVLSLIDPELSLLALNNKRFKEIGVTIIGSSYDACELAIDKMKMYNFCKHNGFNTAKSWNDLNSFKKSLFNNEVSFPVFVKPQCGSASISISKVNNLDTIELLFKNKNNNEHLMIQEYLNGQEIGADVYIDMITKKVISIFTKKKLVMRAGETDKSVSFKDKNLFKLIEKFVNRAGFTAQIDIDIFEVDGEYYISEVNPRFGGGYPHAFECGVNHMNFIINNLNGKINNSVIGNYKDNVYMMKFNEIMIK